MVILCLGVEVVKMAKKKSPLVYGFLAALLAAIVLLPGVPASGIPGDLDGDGQVCRTDLDIILAARNTPADGLDDPRDLDGDGVITALDARKLVLLCTRPRCECEGVAPNSPPVADAGADQTLFVGDTVQLDGSASSDVDGDPLSFEWSFAEVPLGSAATLSDSNAVDPTFLIDLPGIYELELIVNDGTVDSAPDTVTISTENSPPVADAGPDQSVFVTDTVQLDGSASSDVDGDLLTFSWSFFSLPEESTATLSDPLALMPTFYVDLPGTYVLELIVNDGTVDSAPDTVTISTENSPPAANAGPDQTVFVTDIVLLDGSGSSDVDGDVLSYAWSFVSVPEGSGASLSDPTVVDPTFEVDLPGTYVLQLIVNDGTVASAADSTVITTENSRPVADAGPDQEVYVGQSVTLDGSGSSDADNDPLTFWWTFTSIPEQSSALLSDSTTESPSFVPDLPGLYVIQLIVNDGTVDSAPDTVRATAEIYVPPDTDGDGLTDEEEAQLGTNPTNPDSDADGLLDGAEVYTYGTDPKNPDSDGDILTDGEEVNVHGTDPLQTDTDTDGFDDKAEVDAGSDPTDNTSLPGGIPPNPGNVAPAVDPTVATTVAVGTEFLYTGPNPIQTGVSPGTIDPVRAAVLRGKVMTRDGQPLSGVTITILNHPEYGQTLSRVDGMFDMAINGGGLMTVCYEKDGYLTAQRPVEVPWQDFAWLPDVALNPLDTQVTVIDFSEPIEVAQGSVITDEDGTRQATLLFTEGTAAEIVLSDGTTQPVDSLSVRATEYTVGPNGPHAMPAPLPPSSAYTYAVEISADEAVAKVHGKDVLLSQPVYFYVENFIGFPTGTAVPVGYYDNDIGLWIPSENGRVIEIVSINGGLADLDMDGDGSADAGASLLELGVTDAERAQLATLYSPGLSLWRVAIDHFSTWDCNWPYGLPEGAVPPDQPEPQRDDVMDDPCANVGSSIIECQNQVLGERIPVVGTPFTLNYRSDRAPGRRAAYTLNISLSGDSLPPTLLGISLQIEVAGRKFFRGFAPEPNLTYAFTWDGYDIYGRMLQGEQPITTRIAYTYPVVYYPVPSDLQRSFGRVLGQSSPGLLSVESRSALQQGIVWEVSKGLIGAWDARAAGLGGWTLDVHHHYVPLARTLYLGDGGRRTGSALSPIITTVAGGGVGGIWLGSPRGIDVGPDGSLYFSHFTYLAAGYINRLSPEGTLITVAGTGVQGYSGDGGPATEAQLSNARDVAVAPDGSLYISDGGNNRIRRVGQDGIITTVAGTGIRGYSGDGGPATEAQLAFPWGIDVSPDGSIYFVDKDNDCVRRVGPDGIISTVIAGLYNPEDVAVGPEGSIYITDWRHRILRLSPDGMITTVAGNGTAGYSGDGGPATEAQVGYPRAVAVGPDGSIYIGQNTGYVIRKVNPYGIITTVAGNGTAGYSGDAGPATQAQLNLPTGVAIGPDGSLYIPDGSNNLIRRMLLAFPGFSGDEILIPSEDGSELYVFDGLGRHWRTLDALTGALRYEFAYDAAGLLAAVTDGDGNVTSVERDGAGDPTAIVGPYGQRTTLSLDANGYLNRITNPAGESVQLAYTSDGLLEEMTDPNGNTSLYTYDNLGRLTRAEDPAGGFQTLARTELENGNEVTRTTAMGRSTKYRVEALSTGAQRLVNTFPDGTQTEAVINTDGSQTVTYPDGTVTIVQYGPDPRWGMQAPLVQDMTISTSGGLQHFEHSGRTVALTDPNDPLSLETMKDTFTSSGRTYSSDYDADQNLITTTSPEGRQTLTYVDNKGRVVETKVPGLEPTKYSYDPQGRLASIASGSGVAARSLIFSYHSDGTISSVTDPLSQTVGFEYDLAIRILKRILPDGREINYTYDAKGNVSSITPPGRASHLFTFNEVDLGQAYIPPNVGAGTNSMTYSYNLDRQKTQTIRPDGATITRSYEETSGRLDTTAIPRGTLSYAYDPNTGNLETITAPGNGTLSFSYDGGLLLSSTWNDEIAGSVSCTYDNDFHITSESINSGNTISFDYDNDGLLIQAGLLTLNRNAQNGLLTGSTVGNVTDTISHSSFGEMVNYSADFSGTPLFEVQYTRDGLGRITSKTETIDGVTNTYGYTYDLEGRLTEVTLNTTPIASYSYDSNGNRLSHTDTSDTVNATYDGQDRLLQYGYYTYGYTDNGELRSKTDTTTNQTTSYQYDVLGNLMSVELPDSTRINYVVDGLHRRIGKKVNGVLVLGFLYKDQINPIAELDGSGNVIARFIYASRLNVPDYMVSASGNYRIISDHLGSPRIVINTDTGAIVQRMDYDEFGNVVMDTNPGFQPFGFAGGIYDQDTNLVRFGARDYAPEVGRWTTKDPILFGGGQANLYAYTHNDPINFVDPFGMDFCSEVESQAKSQAERVRFTVKDVDAWQEDFLKRHEQYAKLRFLRENLERYAIELKYIATHWEAARAYRDIGRIIREAERPTIDPKNATTKCQLMDQLYHQLSKTAMTNLRDLFKI